MSLRSDLTSQSRSSGAGSTLSGVAEPEVSRQGNTISVQLPGAKDQKEVLKVVGSTAQLEFRPVVAAVGQIPTGAARKKAEKQVEKLRKELAIPEGVTAEQIVADEQAKQQAALGNSDGSAQSGFHRHDGSRHAGRRRRPREPRLKCSAHNGRHLDHRGCNRRWAITDQGVGPGSGWWRQHNVCAAHHCRSTDHHRAAEAAQSVGHRHDYQTVRRAVPT